MYTKNLMLFELLKPAVVELGYELLGIEYVHHGRSARLCVYIDSDIGITVDDCAKVSEKVTNVVKLKKQSMEGCTLEVSSPGVDRPLFTLEQIKKYVGHRLKLWLVEKFHGRRRFTGEVIWVGQEEICIKSDGDEYLIPSCFIDKARLSSQLSNL